MAPPPSVFDPREIATLIINGQEFTDWLTVSVQHRWAEAFQVFTFTCEERVPIPGSITQLQFMPGTPVVILLGGVQALDGFITVRQVGYDKQRHGVQLTGKTLTWQLSKSSVTPTKTGNYDGFPFIPIARAVAGQIGVPVKVIGSIDGTPFRQAQWEPGEIAIDFIERLARNRGVIIGSDEFGNLLLIGDHTSDVQDTLIEGVNIYRANCIISNELINAQYGAGSQVAGTNDETFGKDASEQEAIAPGSDVHPGMIYITVEHPDTTAMIANRARWERQWREGTLITAYITVRGWFAANGDLWRAGSSVWLRSPMLAIDFPLKMKTVTFMQSTEEGTTTELELVLPWHLNDQLFAPNMPSSPVNPPLVTPPGG